MKRLKNIEGKNEQELDLIRDQNKKQSFKSFNYKTGITGKLENNEDELENIKIVVPLKYLSKFFRNLDIPLINAKVSLDL